MSILTNEDQRRLLANGRWNQSRRQRPDDFKPVVKLFCPWGAATWLLTELDPDDPDLAFGLCDLGVGCPEVGNVRLSEITAVRGPNGLSIERDKSFRPTKTLQQYASEAATRGWTVA